MKSAKGLADEIRDTIATATHECSLIGALKKARAFLDAIDSAMPGEVGEIAARDACCRNKEASAKYADVARKGDWDAGLTIQEGPWALLDAISDRATLLAIVQRQAADTQAALNLARGYERERDQQRARAEAAERDLATLNQMYGSAVEKMEGAMTSLADEVANLQGRQRP
jgi:hypothetical protein